MKSGLVGKAILVDVFAILFAFSGLAAQSGGMLAGRVLDADSGEPIEGAAVVVTGPVDRSTLTAKDGNWRVANLPSGDYQVEATHFGFAGESLAVRVTGPTTTASLRLSARAVPLDELVVTAGRRVQRLADVVVPTAVVTRDDIERAGVSDLSRVLEGRLGIQLQGGVASGEGIMLEGLGSERVLVLLDGQPLVGRINGMLDISRIPASSIERVEVVKGPQSSLYGSDAMGGVVNIITRAARPGPLAGSIELTAGTQGRLDGSGSAEGSIAGITYLADAGRRYSELTPGRSETLGALADRWDGLIKLSASPTRSTTLEASALILDERQRWRSGPLFQFSDNRQHSGRIGGSWENDEHRVASSLYYSEFVHDSRAATSPRPVEGTGDHEAQRLIEAEVLYNANWAGYAIDAGVELKREQIDSDRVAGSDATLDTAEPFGQTTIPIGPVRLVPGVRFSFSDHWGTHVTPSLAAAYRPVPSIAIRGSAGAGYRAPSFKELGMEFLNLSAGTGYRVRGNPELRPETSTNVSFVVEWSTATAHLRADAFANRFTDFIETREISDSSGIAIYTYGNVDDGFTRGFELEGGISHGGSRIVAGYAFLQTGDRNTDLELLGRPAHSGRLSVEQTLPWAIRASATAMYTGETPIERTTESTEFRSAFLRVDLHASRDFPGGFEVSIGARNLFDDFPDDWPGYGGRHLYAGIRWRTN